MSDYILELQGISKRFPGVQALDKVDFNVRSGEVHALVGENGAGKSTLIKIVAGVYQQDEGQIIYQKQPVRIENPGHAWELGIATIYQEASLYPDLSVLENMYMGRQPTRGFFIDWRTMQATAEEIFRSMEVEMDVQTRVGELSAAEHQMVEIAKALSQDAHVLIMDEPTSSLARKDIKALFQIVDRLRQRGVAVIYISHRLEEVFELADRVTVLRDGKYIGTEVASEVTNQQLITMMVGRTLDTLFPKTEVRIGEPVMQVEGLSRRGGFQDINLEVHRGEIVGLAGLVGSGRTELARSIFGIDPADEGQIKLNGQPVAIKNPWQALSLGVAYLPEDRQRQGIILALNVRENISLAILEKLCHLGVISFREEMSLAGDFVDKLHIRTPSLGQRVANLSGGNQQKVVVAKWLASQPKVLIVDEPTRGIDVGAKAEIHRLMSDLAGQGIGILMISSELPEILGMSDRILVMNRGRIMGELDRSEATQERIISLATSVISD